MPAYKVKISKVSNMYQIVRDVNSPEQAKEAVWNEISEGWTYHWENKEEFMKNAKVEEVENGNDSNN